MSGRLASLVMIALSVLMIALLVGPTGTFAAGAETDPPMCPPVTLDNLFPPEEPTTAAPTPTTTAPPATAPPTTSGSNNNGESNAPTTTEAVVDPTTTVVAPGPEIPEDCRPFLYEMGWPLADRGRFISRFGAPRDGGTRYHKGADVAAPKLTPVLSVADGRIDQIHNEIGTEDCCWLVVEHDDGWKSWYLHLNNDSYETDDGLGAGIRSDLHRGKRVGQGEVLAWVGDSGNAETTVTHLHFELRNPDGDAVDAWDSLKVAKKESSFGTHTSTGPYTDLSLGESAALVSRLVTEGLHLPCDEIGVRHCPHQAATPEFVSTIATHLAGKQVPALEGPYKRIAFLSMVADNEAMMTILLGCDPPEGCVPFGVSETELARLSSWMILDGLVNSDPLVNPEDAVVVPLATASDSEGSLRRLGILSACHDPLDPDYVLTRSEAVDRIGWWVLGVEPYHCSPAAPPSR